ncbi:MAG: hypothetical protein Q9198_003705 [Flavoplaca austrocitrina]
MARAEAGFAKATSALQSSEHGQLLDVIDHLRALGIDRRVPLPQLVVCGDQSSGKSSVLEAVAGVRFPTKDTLCTRFATELILRRSSSPSIDIKIRPSHDRSPDEQAKLLAFEPPSGDVDQFPQLVEAAKEAIGIDEHTKRFSEDVLRVELSGPDQPHLTLVDLPGVFHSGTKDQSLDEAKLVRSLVQRYMRNKRSIILAVVSAKNDFANQIVTQMARTVDPKGLRTMGIVTKPDTLIPGSDSEHAFHSLLKNEDVVFRLGWHVLRNRDFNTKDYSSEDRDKEEKSFFSSGIWTSLPAAMVGIGPLKPRLSDILRKQIISVLPSMIGDVERGIRECNARLHRLGDTRGTMQEQRQYLIRISQRFSVLIKAAMDGVYGDEYFGDPMTPEGKSKRLRAVIQDMLLRFAEDMRMNGQKSIIVDDTTESTTGRMIYHCDYLDHVGDLMRRTRGRELPGTFNPLIIGDLFYEQSMPWKAMTDRYCESILNVIKKTVSSTTDDATDSATAEGLLQTLLYPALETRKVQFHAKVAEVLEPHRRGHAITYNHYFTDTVQKARNEHQQEEQARRLRDFFGVSQNQDVFYAKQSYKVSKLVGSLAVTTQEDMDRYACSEATYCMKAYYKVGNMSKEMEIRVAMKVLVDNFSVLAVEKCLLRDLADILSPDIVSKLSDDEVSALAAESETSMLERRRATDDLTTLQEGLTVLNRFSRSSGAGKLCHFMHLLVIRLDCQSKHRVRTHTVDRKQQAVGRDIYLLTSRQDTADPTDGDDEEEDQGAMTPPDDDVTPGIQFTKTKHENLAIPNEGYETPVPILEEPKTPEAIEIALEQPAPATLSYEEAVPIEDDLGANCSKKDMKKSKKNSKGIEYAAFEEPVLVPDKEVEAPENVDNDGWASFGVNGLKSKKNASKKKGKIIDWDV